MTTNNHPAHDPVSLDRLHQISEILSKASAQSDGGNLGYAMADAVKVIDSAIAAFGVESAPCPKCNDTGMADSGGVQPWGEPISIECDCRAAMLQSGNHTEQHLDMVEHSGDANENVDCRLPFDQWLSQQNEPIDVDCGCVTTEAFYHWLRVAYEAGNSPVTQDGYVLVPKEMTDDIGEAIAMRANCCGGIALDIYDAMIAASQREG